MESTKKKREAKISSEQKEIYVSFLEKNKIMRIKKSSDSRVQDLWTELCALLNAAEGPDKTIEEWKKTFDNWRYMTHRKMRLIKSGLVKTGGGKPEEISATDLELRASACWGNIVVHGNSGLGVAGCSAIEEKNNNVPTKQFQLEGQEMPLEEHRPTNIVVEEPAQSQPRKRKRTSNQASLSKKTDEDFTRMVEVIESKKQETVEKIESSVVNIGVQLGRIADGIEIMGTEQMAMANAINKLCDVLQKFVEKK